MAFIVMAYIVMAFIAMAFIVMAYTVMAFIAMTTGYSGIFRSMQRTWTDHWLDLDGRQMAANAQVASGWTHMLRGCGLCTVVLPPGGWLAVAHM